MEPETQDTPGNIDVTHPLTGIGTKNPEEMDEMVDLLGMCGCTLSGGSPGTLSQPDAPLTTS